MARPSHRQNKSTQPEYDIKLSTERLETEGFHPKVTLLSPAEYFSRWIQLHDAVMRSKPPKQKSYVGPAGINTRDVTMASLLLNPALVQNKSPQASLAVASRAKKITKSKSTSTTSTKSKASQTQTLCSMLSINDMGVVLAEDIFRHGLKNAQHLAATSTTMWGLLLSNVKLWNFTSGCFHSDSRSGVFVVVAPNHTVGDILRARDQDPIGKCSWNVAATWWEAAIKEENYVFANIQQAKSAPKNAKSQYQKYCNSLGSNATELIKELTIDDDFWIHRQLVLGVNSELFQQTQYILGQRLQAMFQILANRGAIRVLHFEKTPLLDRRLLAVILRSCHKVTSVGIYSCPLIHFGDVICLLDLIGEINQKRRQEGQPLISSFDFFPHFEVGMPYNHTDAATYGLSWNPMDRETAQKGFYAIILKAFLKAQVMGLDCLFAEKGAFRDYLFHVPNVPFGVPCFLDALYRLMDHKGHKGQSVQLERKKARFDLSKAIRLGVAQRWETADWDDTIAQRKLFCTSCGYEMLEDFFTFAGAQARPTERVCSGCSLQHRLERETDHLKAEKRACISALFPEYVVKGFNTDAPVLRGLFENILRLASTQTEAETLQATTNGAMQPHPARPLLRNMKIHYDSLVGLPDLNDLVGKNSAKLWNGFRTRCHHVDAFSCVARLLIDQVVGKPDKAGTIERIRGHVPLGKPDHRDEIQRRRQAHDQSSHTFATALQSHLEMVERGWQPGGSVAKIVDRTRLEVYETTKANSFW